MDSSETPSSRFSSVRAALCLVVLSAVLTAAANPQDPPSPEATGEPEAEAIFLAPFTTASFLRGVAEIAEERKILMERSTGIYLDDKTGLVWTTRDNGKDIDWRRARDYCSELELAGFEDWRLPSLEELESIMQPMGGGQYSTPEQITLTACCPWSSTRKDDVSAWNFNFRFSKRFSGSMTHTYDLRALCLREWREEDGWIPEEPD